LAKNALTIVSELGDPTVFITATYNIMWDVIEERLFDGQTAYNRPDIVCMVFHEKLKLLLQNLRNGNYFNGRKPLYLMYVIEYQHRGLPHAYIVCKLENINNTDDDKIKFINENIFARK
jgi:hypothetical protein